MNAIQSTRGKTAAFSPVDNAAINLPGISQYAVSRFALINAWTADIRMDRKHYQTTTPVPTSQSQPARQDPSIMIKNRAKNMIKSETRDAIKSTRQNSEKIMFAVYYVDVGLMAQWEDTQMDEEKPRYEESVLNENEIFCHSRFSFNLYLNLSVLHRRLDHSVAAIP